MGADHIVQISTRDSRELSRIIIEQLGCSPDQTIECSGAESSIATAIYVSRSRSSSMDGYGLSSIMISTSTLMCPTCFVALHGLSFKPCASMGKLYISTMETETIFTKKIARSRNYFQTLMFESH